MALQSAICSLGKPLAGSVVVRSSDSWEQLVGGHGTATGGKVGFRNKFDLRGVHLHMPQENLLEMLASRQIELATHLANSYIELPHSTVLQGGVEDSTCFRASYRRRMLVSWRC